MTVTAEQIANFAPIRPLPQRVIGYLAEQAWTSKFLPGDDLYDRLDDGSSHFLLSGQISLLTSDRNQRTIDDDSAEAHFPITGPRPIGAISAVCRQPVTLIGFPREIIESIEAFWGSQKSGENYGIQLKEDDLEDRIYLDFYQQIQSGDFELPSMPDIATRISRAVTLPETGSTDLARIIQADPSLTASMIRTANSPAFGGASAVENCRDAITRLGQDNTKNLVTSLVLKNLFHSSSPVLEKRMRQLWLHSRRVAAICQVLAKMSPGMVTDRAMLAGLIHDIGAIPIIISASNYPKLLDDPAIFERILTALKGEVGAMILRHWDFPEEYVATVLHCEEWFRDSEQPPDYTDLVIVAQLLSFVGSQEMQHLPPPDLSPAFHKLVEGRLNPMLSMSVLTEAEKEIKAVEELLEGNG